MPHPRHFLNRTWLPVFLIAAWEICARAGFLRSHLFPPPSVLWCGRPLRCSRAASLQAIFETHCLRTLEAEHLAWSGCRNRLCGIMT